MGKRRAELVAQGELPDPDRTGLFTTGIVSVTADGPIALFCSGRKHGGENFTSLLAARDPGLPPPIHMCDGLDRNRPHGHAVILDDLATTDVLAAELDKARQNMIRALPGAVRDQCRDGGCVHRPRAARPARRLVRAVRWRGPQGDRGRRQGGGEGSDPVGDAGDRDRRRRRQDPPELDKLGLGAPTSYDLHAMPVAGR
jgi:hypothetical protein